MAYDPKGEIGAYLKFQSRASFKFWDEGDNSHIKDSRLRRKACTLLEPLCV